MSVRILHDEQEGFAALYDSVSETAFGPLFENSDQAQAFLDWCEVDTRRFDDHQLRQAVSAFRIETGLSDRWADENPDDAMDRVLDR